LSSNKEVRVRACRACGGRLEEAFRFCPWCAAPLRRKLVELLPAAAVHEADRGKALRVSLYLDEGHARFSVWDGTRAEAAVSIEEPHVSRLRALLSPRPAPRRSRLAALADRAGRGAVNRRR
jgi:hypothetical protein